MQIEWNVDIIIANAGIWRPITAWHPCVMECDIACMTAQHAYGEEALWVLFEACVRLNEEL